MIKNKFILQCAKLSNYSYSDLNDFSHKIKNDNIKYDDLVLLNEKGCQAYILNTKNEIFVIIKGSSEIDDFLTNLKFFNKKDKIIKARIHEGFKQYADNIFIQLKKYLKQNSKNKEIYLIGHSLGGSIAKILSLRLTNNLNCITFGEPKSFKSSPLKETFYVKNFYRIANSKDFITNIPNFYHHGKISNEKHLYFNLKGNLIVNPVNHEIKRENFFIFMLNIISFKYFINIFFKKSIKNHEIKNYIKLLEKNLN